MPFGRRIAPTLMLLPALLALGALTGCADPLMRQSHLPEKIDFSGGGQLPPAAAQAPPPATEPTMPVAGAAAGAGGAASGTGAASRPAVAGEAAASTRSSDVNLSPVPPDTRRPPATQADLPARPPEPSTRPGL